MQVTFINVGYGDAILIQQANGYTALLDGGSALPEEFQGDPFRVRGIDYLQSQGIQHLDAVWISHIHEDHVCGLEPVMEKLQVDRLYVPYPTEPFLNGKELQAGDGAPRSVPLYTAALNAYRRILLRAAEKHIPVQVLSAGDRIDAAPGCTVQVLAPRPSVIAEYVSLIQAAYDEADDAPTELLTQLDRTSNHTSLLLRIESEGMSLLAAADSCPAQWDEVPISLFKNVTVLKLPHHGQIDSISEQFMREMGLSYVVTTSASDRRYNSANPKVYEQLCAWYPADRRPAFLFSDERSYPPHFSQPEGFQAITLVMNSGTVRPEFIKIQTKKENTR